jgi:hypothetical protein
MSTTLNPAPTPPTSPFGVFRTLFESGRNNDCEAMADTIDENCERPSLQ